MDPLADKLLTSAAFLALVQMGLAPAWMVAIIIGRELAVTALRGVALSMGVVIPASALGKWKTATQYVAVTMLILEKGVPAEAVPFHLVSRIVLWLALGVTAVSGADYFYRFVLKTGFQPVVKDGERWP